MKSQGVAVKDPGWTCNFEDMNRRCLELQTRGSIQTFLFCGTLRRGGAKNRQLICLNCGNIMADEW
jgi:hypothetical protein